MPRQATGRFGQRNRKLPMIFQHERQCLPGARCVLTAACLSWATLFKTRRLNERCSLQGALTRRPKANDNSSTRLVSQPIVHRGLTNLSVSRGALPIAPLFEEGFVQTSRWWCRDTPKASRRMHCYYVGRRVPCGWLTSSVPVLCSAKCQCATSRFARHVEACGQGKNRRSQTQASIVGTHLIERPAHGVHNQAGLPRPVGSAYQETIPVAVQIHEVDPLSCAKAQTRCATTHSSASCDHFHSFL